MTALRSRAVAFVAAATARCSASSSARSQPSARRLGAGGAVLLLLAVVPACGGDQDRVAGGSAEEPATSTTTTPATAGGDDITTTAPPSTGTTAPPTTAKPGAVTTTTKSRTTTTTALPVPAVPASGPCTADIAARARSQPVLLAATDLEAMVLTGGDLGAAVTGLEHDWLRSGYSDNAELRELFPSPPAVCDDAVRLARITGYALGFDSMSSRWVSSGAQLFFDDGSARGWIDAFASGLRGAAGTEAGPDKVVVAAVPGVEGGIRLDLTDDGWSFAYSLFPIGPVVGTILEAHGPGAAFRVDLPAMSARLAARIGEVSGAAAARGAPAVSMAQLVAAPLPQVDLGPAYAKLTWDWLFGGCIGNQEQVQNDVDGDEQADIDRFGRVAGCKAMYSAEFEDPTSDVLRVISAVTQFRDAAGAGGYLDDSLGDLERLAGTTRDGVEYQSAERFAPAGPGDQPAGLRMTFRQAGKTIYYTGVFVRRGALTGTVVLHEYTGRDARLELTELARRLDARMQAVIAPATT